MGIINNVNLNEIEDSLEEVVGLTFQTKFFQEQYEIIMNQIKTNKSSFSSGKISRDIYNKNKIILENEKNKLNKKIDVTTEKIRKINEKIQKNIEGYRI